MLQDVSQFKGWLREEGYAQRTIERYASDVDELMGHQDSERLLVEDPVKLLQKGLSGRRPAKIYRATYALRAFLRYVGVTDGLELPLPDSGHLGTSEHETVTETAYLSMLKAASEAKEPYLRARDLVALHLLYYSGIRISELVGLDTQNVSISESQITVSIDGKPPRKRKLELPLDNRFLNMVLYPSIRGDFLAQTGSSSDAFVLNKYGDRISDKSVRRNLEGIVTAAGSDFNAIDIRASYSRRQAEAGLSKEEIAKLLGIYCMSKGWSS